MEVERGTPMLLLSLVPHLMRRFKVYKIGLALGHRARPKGLEPP